MLAGLRSQGQHFETEPLLCRHEGRKNASPWSPAGGMDMPGWLLWAYLAHEEGHRASCLAGSGSQGTRHQRLACACTQPGLAAHTHYSFMGLCGTAEQPGQCMSKARVRCTWLSHPVATDVLQAAVVSTKDLLVARQEAYLEARGTTHPGEG